jgi:hypothetical protein
VGASAAFDLLQGNKSSAIGNLAGDEIIVHLSTPLDVTYGLHLEEFMVSVNLVSSSISSVSYNLSDYSDSKIIIKRSGHPPARCNKR